MSRFEKKCFIGSAALHGLLLVVFLFGAAFLPSKKPEKLPPVITFMNPEMTDRLIASGGNPNGNPEPPAPAPQPSKVEPQPPPPEPPKPEVKPKPEKSEPVKTVEPRKDLKPVPEKDKADVPKKQPDKKQTETAVPKPRINTQVTRRTNDLARLDRERADREARDRKAKEELARYNAARQRIASKVDGIVDGVASSLSKSTVAEPIGPGGAAYANYASYVGEAYKRAVYAEHPQSDEDANAVIRVVVTRDGTVRSSQWVRRTSNPVLNKAVDRAMGKVDKLPEFPPETKDSERSFNITIAFEAKRVSA